MREIIQKAVDGGYDISDYLPMAYGQKGGKQRQRVIDTIIFAEFDKIIFSHQFLKAFFGEYQLCEDCLNEPETESCNPDACKCEKSYSLEAWMVHAQRLVLVEDRIEYLRRYLTKG